MTKPSYDELVTALREAREAMDDMDYRIHSEWGVGSYAPGDDLLKVDAVLARVAVEPTDCQCGHPMACHDELSCAHYGCDCKGAAVKSRGIS